MNQGVALVQAYLHVNGYFTVTEYPVMDVLQSGEPFTMTTWTSWPTGSRAPVMSWSIVAQAVRARTGCHWM